MITRFLHDPLSPDLLETTNRLLDEVESVFGQVQQGEAGVYAVGYFFNKRARTFHSHLQILPENVEAVLQEATPKLKAALAAGYTNAEEGSWAKVLEELSKGLSTSEPPLRVFEKAYPDIPVATDEGLGGQVYSALKSRANPSDPLAFVSADLKPDKTKGYPTSSTPHLWVSSSESFFPSATPSETPQRPRDTRRFAVYELLTECLYLRGLDEKIGAAARELLVAPIYDVWCGGKGAGGIWGVLVYNFWPTGDRDKHVNGTLMPRLLERLRTHEKIASSYLSAGLAKIPKEPIHHRYDGLLELFVSRLHWIQDWQRVTVRSRSQVGMEGKILYCYRHRPLAEHSIESTWVRCSPHVSATCHLCEPRSGAAASARTYADHVHATANDCSSCLGLQEVAFSWESEGRPHNFTRAPEEHRILNNRLIKGLAPAEEAALRDLDVEFVFPNTAVVPMCPKDEAADGAIDKAFLFEVERQHLAALRSLLPIVRTRRALLRTATSAIMGRNMSHNIGSHVLARYSSQIGTDLLSPPSSKEDHRAVFLRYLQRRMDFIAEIATSDCSLWSQPLDVRETLKALDFDSSWRRHNDGLPPNEYKLQEARRESRLPILLSYISGKEEIAATVTVEGDDQTFACPSGEIGAHALYVILENVIRNSARHNKCLPKRIDLQVLLPSSSVAQGAVLLGQGCPADLLCLRIVDRTTRFQDPLGNPVVPGINELLSLPLLNSDGSMRSEAWGLREMQICAQFLRGRSLSDLEAPEPIPPVLEAKVHNLGEDHWVLAYDIYLSRAKLCAFVSPELGEAMRENAALNDKFAAVGIGVFDNVLDQRICRYSFAVADPSVWNPSTEPRPTAFPIRAFSEELGSNPALLPTDSQGVQRRLDRYHERTWKQYKALRCQWMNRDLRALVAWEQAPPGDPPWALDEIRPIPPSSAPFHHVQIRAEEASHYRRAHEYPHYPQRDKAPLDLIWFGHLGPERLTYTTSPFLSRIFDADPAAHRDDPAGWVYLETCDSLSPHHSYLESVRAGDASGHELLAAALARVAVLDERVQAEYRSGRYREIPLEQLWRFMGVWVPNPNKCHLDQPSLDAVASFLRSPIQADGQHLPDFVVLHLTLLEGLAKQVVPEAGRSSIAQTLTVLRRQMAPQSNPVFVLVTGRGITPLAQVATTADLHARHLPVSALLEYLVARPSKLALMRSLWSAASLHT